MTIVSTGGAPQVYPEASQHQPKNSQATSEGRVTSGFTSKPHHPGAWFQPDGSDGSRPFISEAQLEAAVEGQNQLEEEQHVEPSEQPPVVEDVETAAAVAQAALEEQVQEEQSEETQVVEDVAKAAVAEEPAAEEIHKTEAKEEAGSEEQPKAQVKDKKKKKKKKGPRPYFGDNKK